MTAMKLRHSARAIVLDEQDRVLLCRFGVPHPAVPTGATVVWAAPVAASNTVKLRSRHLATPLNELIMNRIPAAPVTMGL